MGFIAENPSAWAICETLVREAVAVAAGEGIESTRMKRSPRCVRSARTAPPVLTSIYADLRTAAAPR